MTSVGELLKQERVKLGINLDEVEKQIKIRQKFLQAVEENNWNIFTSKIYINGIIKNYSLYLGLDPKKTLAFFRRDYERLETVRFKKKVSSRYLAPETRKLAALALILVFLIFFGYFGYQLKVYFSPPKVTIISPKTEVIKKEDKVKVIGKTEKDASVTIFGDRIFQNKEGVFEYEFPLHKGKNELSIEVVGANGKKSVVKKIFTKQE